MYSRSSRLVNEFDRKRDNCFTFDALLNALALPWLRVAPFGGPFLYANPSSSFILSGSMHDPIDSRNSAAAPDVKK